jgi:glycyl-tRNA synthetase
LYDDLKIHYNISYDEKDAVGRRYRRQDAIGTPVCITVDHDSLNDDMITIRDRDTMNQTRVKIKDLKSEIDKLVNISNWLSKS